MSAIDTRHLSRDSLFLVSDLRLDGETAVHRVKVRNLSAGGMLAEGALQVVPGTSLMIQLRNIGAVRGVVAWAQKGRFGIAFPEEIDPKLVREPVKESDINAPRFTRTIGYGGASAGADPSQIRKI